MRPVSRRPSDASASGRATTTAETVGVIILLVVAGLIFKLKASKLPRIVPDQTANGAHASTGPGKHPGFFQLRRQRSDSVKQIHR